METIIAFETQLTDFNKLVIEIDPTFNNDFSILAYDEFDIWIEEYSNSLESAKQTAKALHDKIVQQYFN